MILSSLKDKAFPLVGGFFSSTPEITLSIPR